MALLKRAVVTGATGFIGSPLVRRLRSIGCEVIATERRDGSESGPGVVAVGSGDWEALAPFLNPDTVVFHLAASADVGASVVHPRTDFESTLVSFFEVLELARRFGCPFIFPSTGSIFDPGNQQPVDERARVGPSSPYAAAKAAGEGYCQAYFRSYGLDTRIARLFSVYGIGIKKRFLISELVQKIEDNPHEILLRGDGQQVRDYLYVDDVVDGLIAIAAKGAPGEDYNLASGVPIRILDLAREVARLMGCPDVHIRTSDAAPRGEVPAWYADVSKIRRIGFVPSIPLNQGLKRTVDWLKGNG